MNLIKLIMIIAFASAGVATAIPPQLHYHRHCEKEIEEMRKQIVQLKKQLHLTRHNPVKSSPRFAQIKQLQFPQAPTLPISPQFSDPMFSAMQGGFPTPRNTFTSSPHSPSQINMVKACPPGCVVES